MHEFRLLLSATEGALVRVLGTIERRGFRLGAIESRPGQRGVQLNFTLAPGGRSPEVLLRQIQRLHDVLEASFRAAASDLPAAGQRPVRSADDADAGAQRHELPGHSRADLGDVMCVWRRRSKGVYAKDAKERRSRERTKRAYKLVFARTKHLATSHSRFP
jgi:acetolactate synthase II small subunit